MARSFRERLAGQGLVAPTSVEQLVAATLAAEPALVADRLAQRFSLLRFNVLNIARAGVTHD
jgi:hypothetical protein